MGFFRGKLSFDVFNFDLFLSKKQGYIFLQNCFQILSVCVALSDALYKYCHCSLVMYS